MAWRCKRSSRRNMRRGLVPLEHDQPHPIAPLVGIDQQAQDGALGSLHPLAGRHAPTGIHHEQNQVGSPTDAHLALDVARPDGQGEVVVCALPLVGGCLAQGGVEGDVVVLSLGWAGLDVATALAVGAGQAAATGRAPRETVQRGIDAAHLGGPTSGYHHIGLLDPAQAQRGRVVAVQGHPAATDLNGGLRVCAQVLFFFGVVRGARFTHGARGCVCALGPNLLQVGGDVFGAQLAVLERLALESVGQGQFGRGQDVGWGDAMGIGARPSVGGQAIGGMGKRGLEDDDVGAVAVDLEARRELGDGVEVIRNVGDGWQQGASPGDVVA
jgi:hypothetical protein